MYNLEEVLEQAGIKRWESSGYYPSLLIGTQAFYTQHHSHLLISPIDAQEIGRFHFSQSEELALAIQTAQTAFKHFRNIPAPKRGAFVHSIAKEVRKNKESLAAIITLETGKIMQESLGEVQEWIDMCDFAVGQSRMLHGLTINSERPKHRMMEQWLPLGVVGVISAFNFPMAVWAWNAMLAFICGNAVIWKPSNRSLLSALAVQKIVTDALKDHPDIPQTISTVIIGSNEVGTHMATDKGINLLSATGSVAMGKILAPLVAQRLGRSLLELGGNNAMIVTPSANLDLALRAIVFAAVGTSGQRCTTLRRIIVHKSIKDQLVDKIIESYKTLKIGNPFEPSIHMGPIIDYKAYYTMQDAISEAKHAGGKLLYGGELQDLDNVGLAFYVTPALMRVPHDAEIVKQETFAPLLYIIEYDDFDKAIEIQNSVTQGLSSAIFSQNLQEVETFLSTNGSDCGIANVNIGTTGAEIGGAFGGEKDTGGGRESGSDAWKAYMRRTTNTINYSNDLPLAQGISFGSK